MHGSWEGKKTRMEISSIVPNQPRGYQNYQTLP